MKDFIAILKHLAGQHEQKAHARKGGGAMKHAPVKPGVDFRSKGMRDTRKFSSDSRKCCQSNTMENSDKVVNKITKRSGVPRKDVDDFMSIWNSGTFNNSPSDTAQVRNAIAEEMGTGFTPFEKKLGITTTKIDPEKHKKYKKVARAMYDETQAEFKSRGMTEVPLHRGAVLPKGQIKVGGTFSTVTDKHKPNSSESWTASNDVANEYGTIFSSPEDVNVVMSATFPVSRIFSTSLTGAGTTSESEFIVLGGDDITVETGRAESS